MPQSLNIFTYPYMINIHLLLLCHEVRCFLLLLKAYTIKKIPFKLKRKKWDFLALRLTCSYILIALLYKTLYATVFCYYKILFLKDSQFTKNSSYSICDKYVWSESLLHIFTYLGSQIFLFIHRYSVKESNSWETVLTYNLTLLGKNLSVNAV